MKTSSNLVLLLTAFIALAGHAPSSPAVIGGDDVLIGTGSNPQGSSAGIAGDGTLYAAVDFDNPTTGREISVYRSQDGGLHWVLWGVIAEPDPALELYEPSLHVAEGAVSRCYVAYTVTDDTRPEREIHVAYSDLALAQGDFSNRTVALAAPGKEFFDPALTSDAVTYNSFYLFLVAAEYDPPEFITGSQRIWYARSINRGDSFTNSMVLDSKSGTGLYDPDISYGAGNYVHVVWRRHGGGDWTQINYRRGASTGTTIATWDEIQVLQPPDEEQYEVDANVAASPTGNGVLVVCERRHSSWMGYTWVEPGVLASNDQGASFPISAVIENAPVSVRDLVLRPATDEWVLIGGEGDALTLQTAAAADPTNWSDPADLVEDPAYNLTRATAVVDPTHDDRVGVVFENHYWGSPDFHLMFDGEWHADPGYPNLAPGFPVDLPAHPLSPPAVADIDGDGDLEIVFGDAAGNVQVYAADGSVHPGWPQNVPAGLSRGPVAVGDLNADGLLEVAAGAADGHAWLWDHTGSLLWTLPIGKFVTDPVYVSIGALGPPYPRYVVLAGGDQVRLANRSGRFQGRETGSLGGLIEHAPAIGDIDGDGVSEWVVAAGNRIVSGHLPTTRPPIDVTLPAAASDAPTLGDLDLDGDVEVIVPTDDGVLHVLDDDGDPFPGSWPFISPEPVALTSAPVAQVRGTTPPEIAVGVGADAFLLNPDGTVAGGYPVATGSPVRNTAAPILGAVEGSPDVIVGSRDASGWAWDNFGQVVTGWPQEIADQIQLSPALGDLDQDGLTEVVLLSYNQLIVLDVNDPFDAVASQLWAMYGHDARRSGCADCPEDLVSAVPPPDAGPSPLGFAAPRPNPFNPRTTISFVLERGGPVRLDVYNLRGERVRQLARGNFAAGPRGIVWDGKDDAGLEVASGTYTVILEALGVQASHKVTLLK